MSINTTKLREALKEAERALARARALLADEPDEEAQDVLYARRMLSVLAEVDRRGGRVATGEILDIGEAFGYRRRGMAGFYQDLLAREGDDAVLTDEGRERLARLRSRYDSLTPPPMTHPFWSRAFPEDPKADSFYRHVVGRKVRSGKRYSAEDAKRELYDSWS